MKLCDRCTVSGCCLNYLGKACEHARQETCPEVQPGTTVVSKLESWLKEDYKPEE